MRVRVIDEDETWAFKKRLGSNRVLSKYDTLNAKE